MLAVEASMRYYAAQFGGDIETWGITGLLHDFDWEIHPSMDQHPQDGAPILRERGVPEEVITAILSHANHTGIPRQSDMEKALYACDEITGLIVAVALVRPSHSINDVKIKSVKKKGKGYEVRLSSYMSDKSTWEKIGDTIGATLISFKPGSINIGIYE